MRRLRYSVAASLDGYIAGPNGEFDWITIDPDIDFAAMYASYSHIVMGRHSYDVFESAGGGVGPALPVSVCSTTLPEGVRGHVTFVRDAVAHVRTLKKDGASKPIWLWGGGTLATAMAEAGLLDSVEVAVIPIVLGGGIPLFAPPAPKLPLRLTSHRRYEKTGIVMLEYDVVSRR